MKMLHKFLYIISFIIPFGVNIIFIYDKISSSSLRLYFIGCFGARVLVNVCRKVGWSRLCPKNHVIHWKDRKLNIFAESTYWKTLDFNCDQFKNHKIYISQVPINLYMTPFTNMVQL